MLPDTTNASRPQSGYTLPVFACASAIAALQHLMSPDKPVKSVAVDLINPTAVVDIPIEQVASLPNGSTLAITRCEPGDNLDITRNTPIWAIVEWGTDDQAERVCLAGGEGLGRQINAGNQAAIYAYARKLVVKNLASWLPENRTIRVTIVLPEGRSLALRTSNAAFGVVDGLSLLGTSGISEPLSAPGQLDAFRQTVRDKARQFDTLVFCVGENGLNRALTLGINAHQRIKTGNWIGPLLVEAAVCDVKRILLLGYHGKLIKLAGGIFHTHHSVADGRQEILAAIAAAKGLPTEDVQYLLSAATVEAGLSHLRHLETTSQSAWVQLIYQSLVQRVDDRAMAYVQNYGDRNLTVGTTVFDRQRQFIASSDRAQAILQSLLVS
ncbi:cobalt-precorrin-5B (C(1))-methyltransferase CbiD [Oscillatoria sp. CS-180]|uniref:cobalt-precorrin-5B (C(1))-methyltransferase CbiD n=1 Tax=Oscillatoria sp. CS-180 TaxID=3021720 RepID=UPI00232E6E0B|nr:cobalt-precorrin-5B (C(1))-methyltransferase CbiD [Oscillatoria sp. CS-180]MDB9525895.1 cobalt-precorrin-5B (C(1))-methyltransferase CbiD [Oscillatoria sp. CS-180]